MQFLWEVIIIKEFLSIGRIINTHGVRGEMKMDVWCDGTDTLKKVSTVFTDEQGKNALNITGKRVHGNFLLITVEGIDTLDAAIHFKGKELYARREDIPKSADSFFIADLIGLCVYDAKNNELIGKVSDVFNRGASDILEIKKLDSKESLVPMVKEFMAKIDPENGIYINVTEGLLD